MRDHHRSCSRPAHWKRAARAQLNRCSRSPAESSVAWAWDFLWRLICWPRSRRSGIARQNNKETRWQLDLSNGATLANERGRELAPASEKNWRRKGAARPRAATAGLWARMETGEENPLAAPSDTSHKHVKCASHRETKQNAGRRRRRPVERRPMMMKRCAVEFAIRFHSAPAQTTFGPRRESFLTSLCKTFFN